MFKKKNSGQEERRQYIRLDSVFPVRFRIFNLEGSRALSDWLQGFTSNVSKGGICLSANDLKSDLADLIKDKQVKLSMEIRMPLAAAPVSATGMVSWVKDNPEQPGGYLVGLNYEEILDTANRRIMRYATTRRIIVPLTSAVIIILSLAFVFGSYLNLKLAESNKALKKELQTKIVALQSSIQVAKDERAALQKLVKSSNSSLQAAQSKLQEAIKQERDKTAARVRTYNLKIKKLSDEKAVLQKKFSMMQQETIRKAAMYFKKGNYDRTISELTAAIEFTPNKVFLYNKRSQAYVKKGDFDKAILDLSQAIKLSPKDGNFYYYRALAFKMKGELDKAVADLEKALELNPKMAAFYNGRGEIYLKKGEAAKAASDFEKAIELNPKSTLAYANLVQAYYQNKEFDKAWETMQKAQLIGLKPDPQFLEELKKASGKEIK